MSALALLDSRNKKEGDFRVLCGVRKEWRKNFSAVLTITGVSKQGMSVYFLTLVIIVCSTCVPEPDFTTLMGAAKS